MANRVRQSAASLRIFGNELKPMEISRILRCEPTQAREKGEVVKYPFGREQTSTCGRWILTAERAEPVDLDGQIKRLVAQMSNDLEVWKTLTTYYDVDMFCGAFMQSGNARLSISAETMLALGSRGILLSLDIYSQDSEDEF